MKDFDAPQGRKPDAGDVRAPGPGDWLGELASARGVSVNKLLHASILASCRMPSNWSSIHRVAVLLELIRQSAERLHKPIDRQIALVALNSMLGLPVKIRPSASRK